MSETPNFWPLFDRLSDDEALAADAAELVGAALQGDDPFAEALTGTPVTVETGSRPPPGSRPLPPAAFLQRLEVERFRGIGPKVSFNLPPGPGLTLIVGRNGSGKSSLAEGLEMLLTGDSLRWARRKPARQWTSGWRNLHDPGSVNLRATFAVHQREQPVTLTRKWPAEATLQDSALSVVDGACEHAGLGTLGWDEALQTYRPFLSYNELSTALESGPSKLFDALEGLLGLDDVAEARERVRQARLTRERAAKDSRSERKRQIEALQHSDDERAAKALEAFGARATDLGALETLVLATEEEASESELRQLRQLAALAVPDEVAVLETAEAVTAAVGAQAAQAATDAGRAFATAKLLEQALAWFERREDATCPVCQTPEVLGEAWQAAARARAEEMTRSAKAAHTAASQVDSTIDALRRLVRNVAVPTEHGLADYAAAADARRAWGELPDAPLEMAAHVESHWPALQSAYAALSRSAASELEALQVAWRPLQRGLAAWLDGARAAEADETTLKALKSAEEWLKAAEADLRDDAFTPIADQAQATWELLRQQSNVELGIPKLAGSSTNRKVELNITVDGTSGVALGVMSQGELHALALSLFLPRLTRPDSPFRFVIIDDPVQAMDPAKVDGLARVLDGAARTHQVIVFTHDSRLPAAARRLGISARVLEVSRHTESRVEVRPAFDPVTQHLSDARHMYSQREQLGGEVVRTVVPGLCRAAVEAALVERTWSLQLGNGRAHGEIESDLGRARGLTDLAALAFFGDSTRGGEVLRRLNSTGGWAADHFQELKAHAHVALPGSADVNGFISTTDRLAREIRG